MNHRASLVLRMLVTWFVVVAALLRAAPANALPAGVTATQLAGRDLSTAFPHFEYVKAFNVGAAFSIGLDPRFLAAPKTCRIYIVAHKSDAQWNSSPALVDARAGGFQAGQSFGTSSIVLNIRSVSNVSQLSGAGGVNLGVGYDAVLDCNSNGVLDSGDYIDTAGAEAGLYIVLDTTLAGPYAVSNATYTVSGTAIPQARVYYPTSIASLGMLPLVGISHGNGFNYTQYSQLATHLASYGYIVVSLGTNTGAGILAASSSTLEHTVSLIGLQGSIAGGVLNGHIDANRIVWLGHSRGGEGVVLAYDRLQAGEYPQPYYSSDDIALVSSMAPTNFLNDTIVAVPRQPSPHDVPYHVWTVTADKDVLNHPSNEITLSPQLWARAEGFKQFISIYGAGHKAFTDLETTESGVPCALSTTEALKIVKGYSVPLLKRYTDANIPAKDFLWRQWESFRPKGVPAPEVECKTVNLVYHEPVTSGTYVVDNYDSNPSTTQSSAGAPVAYTVQKVQEALLRDRDFTYIWSTIPNCRCSIPETDQTCSSHPACDNLQTYCDCGGSPCVCAAGTVNCAAGQDPCPSNGWGTCTCDPVLPSDPMNGATYEARDGLGRGVTFEWSGSTERYYDVQIPVAARNLTPYRYLSFRAAQTPRHPNTVSTLGDLDFSVELRDDTGHTSAIKLSAFGGGIEEPYQRKLNPNDQFETPGWAAELETIRIRLTDFLNKDITPNLLDLSHVASIRLRFASSAGSTPGRIILDDLELTID